MLKSGLYELMINRDLNKLISEIGDKKAQIKEIDDGESHDILSEYLRIYIANMLREIKVKRSDKLSKQIEICNDLIKCIANVSCNKNELLGEFLVPEANQLLSIVDNQSIPHPDRPDTPLSRGCILTGTRLDPSFDSQIRKEINTATRIDILCSFIKWSGIRIIENELKEFVSKPGNTIRVITTSYMGATDLKAIDFLSRLPNTEIKVSYDTKRTRLHAKAYVFHRDTNFGAAYIGSANISHSAFTDGLEWNVKVSQYESTHMWTKVTAAFETYWNDTEFVSYSHNERSRLREALKNELKGASDEDSNYVSFDLRPFQFQQEILDQIDAERLVAGRTRHLVVAATGTGKTMIAAFDYKKWCSNVKGNRPRFLFVVHREEILQQSLRMFRMVLRDQNFGDLWVGMNKPDNFDHLFISIQTYNSQKLWELFESSYFQYVVIDEFHRAGAPWYDNLLSHISPENILGLTATPERNDGVDVLRYFGGHMSAEIRLPDAINRKLLCPFQYFGVTDNVNLDGLTWQRGGYVNSELNDLFTGNDMRAQLVIQKVNEIILDPRQACGLGFCVSIAHADYMAKKFQESGILAKSLSSESSHELRKTIQKQLRDREINFIFTVDLYNEGVDIPEIDTVLFLRPTESLTVFLQQFGRGLRHHDGKDYLTVLDFIGQAHAKYRFDIRYKALIDDSSRSINDQIDQGFPHLPAGCSIQIERIAKQYILSNIRQNLLNTKSYLIQEISEMQDRFQRVPELGEFLDFYKLDADDIYRKGVSWSRLCFEAKSIYQLSDPDEDILTKGFRRIKHIDGIDYINTLLKVLKIDDLSTLNLDETSRRYLLMMIFSIFGKNCNFLHEEDCIYRIRQNPVLLVELIQLLEYKLNKIESIPQKLDLPFTCPLNLHAQYTRDEILAALGFWSINDQKDLREGVRYIPDIKVDIFLITFNKTEKDYSPTTMYEDYAISDTLFHWQSQSQTSDTSETGRRYIEHKQNNHTILLFVRENKTVDKLACPYYFLGPADYVSHEGSNPISFIWQLRYPMPSRLLRKTIRLAVI